MTFIESVRSCLENYDNFSGRASRSEYWWFYLFYVVGSVAANFIDRALGAFDAEAGIPLFGLLWGVALFLPNLAVTVRRYHDRDFRGWWIFVPIVNLVLLFLKGAEGENRFGPEPELEQVQA